MAIDLGRQLDTARGKNAAKIEQLEPLTNTVWFAFLRIRVGRSAMAKQLDESAVLLAVVAHIRRAETNYDEILSAGYERWEARQSVAEIVDQVLKKWEK